VSDFSIYCGTDRHVGDSIAESIVFRAAVWTAEWLGLRFLCAGKTSCLNTNGTDYRTHPAAYRMKLNNHLYLVPRSRYRTTSVRTHVPTLWYGPTFIRNFQAFSQYRPHRGRGVVKPVQLTEASGPEKGTGCDYVSYGFVFLGAIFRCPLYNEPIQTSPSSLCNWQSYRMRVKVLAGLIVMGAWKRLSFGLDPALGGPGHGAK
jgi:hypothetical protein